MAKEPLRKCSHCGGVGHNMRTCDTLRGRNLGVRAQVLTKTSCSLESCDSLASENKSAIINEVYRSDDQIQDETDSMRKKGLTWSHEEHQRFLLGLTKYGKGEWKPISDHFVPSRTSAQVASHAQKHFKRLESMKKQRPSLFDVPLRQQDRIRENIENRFQIHCSDSGGHPITPVSADLNSQNMGRYQESETPQSVSQAGIDIYNHFLSYCSTHQHYPTTTPASADLNSQEMDKGLRIEQETEGNHPPVTSTITDDHMFTNTEDPITLYPSGKFQNETAEQDLLNQKLELH